MASTHKHLKKYLNDASHVIHRMLWCKNCDFVDACDIGNYEKIFELMPKNDDCSEGLYASTAQGFTNIVKKMIKKMELQRSEKSMFLIYCDVLCISSQYGHFDITKFIINLIRRKITRKYGYDFGLKFLLISWIEFGNLEDDFNKALYLAIFNNHMNIVELLLKNGANIKYGFYCACESGHIKIVRLILGKSNRWKSKQFTNGLNLAYDNEHLEIVRLMLDIGAFNRDQGAP